MYKLLNVFKTKGFPSGIAHFFEVLEYRLFGIRRQKNDAIAFFCEGDCIEVGAFSRPAILPNAISIEYADVTDADEAKLGLESIGYFGYHNEKFVDVSIKFDGLRPPLESVPSKTKDCVFSSHSLEHSPNPISALVDYLRVLKPGGIVYSIIPNKNYTYDVKRKSTDVRYLIERHRKDIWTYSLDQYRDVFYNTTSHVVYNDATEKDIKKAFDANDGLHHVFVYDPQNTMEIINFLTDEFGCTLEHFDASNQFDIHFALKKM